MYTFEHFYFSFNVFKICLRLSACIHFRSFHWHLLFTAKIMTIFFEQNGINLLAGAWFLICFNGYIRYAKARNYRSNASSPSLASEMHRYRCQWMDKILTREMRVADIAAIANLEKSVSFFASTTMLILAGLITILGSTEKAIDLVSALPFAQMTHRAEWELKIIMLILLFAYAFFKFTWSLRQYGFVTIMIGSAPIPTDQCGDDDREAFAGRMASLASMAANNFNIGLRTYYFSISMLTWFIHPVLFMFSASLVVFILFRREFKSSTLKILTEKDNQYYN